LTDKVIVEGMARVVVPEGVFYNPLARFSRSFAIPILAMESSIRGRELIVGDLMAASGVRGIRYFLESGCVSEVWFNDRSRKAFDTIKLNVRENGVDGRVFNMDVRALLYSDALYKLDFIDIDPFGTPSPYIDSAVASVREGGLVVLTATDLTALCGLYPRAAFRKYFSMVRKTWFCHEVALRVLIYSCLVAAGRHDRYIEPVISVFTEQYARVYLRVREGKIRYPYGSVGFILYREGESIDVAPLKSIGGEASIEKGVMVIGPMWIGPLHNNDFIDGIFDRELFNRIAVEGDRLRAAKLLKVMRGEADLPPYYYDIHKLSSMVGISPPPVDKVIRLLVDAGYRVSRTQFSGHGLKTDCSLRDFLDLLRGLPR